MNKFSKINLLFIFIVAFVIDSCSYPEMVRNELVYENDFESSDLNSIDGGDIMSFNNTNVIGDFNNDGLQDVYLARQQDGGKLFQNLGGFTFKDVTKSVGIKSESFWSTGVSFIDINNDDKLDLYVCAFDSPNKLYINTGDYFVESAKEYGLDFSGASVSMSFADFDLDGDLDAYLLTNRLHDTDSTLNVKTIKDGKIHI